LQPQRPLESSRQFSARLIIVVETVLMALIAIPVVNDALVKRDGGSVFAGVLAVAGTVFMVVGATRMHRDTPGAIGLEREPGGERRVPWDWSDFLVFWPASFASASLFIQVLVPVVQAFDGFAGPDTRNAVEQLARQALYYAGPLFNIYVLAGLRRGATLRDLGWRAFRWWWVIAAVAGFAAAYYGADYLEQVSRSLFPSAPNTQCVAVRHDFSHSLVLGVLVVCVLAPLAEETIFRGFVYGYLRRWAPVPLAIPISGAIFAALHMELLLLLPLFAVGCILALAFQGSRSLWPGALVHALFNLPNLLVLLSPTYSC
jgi:membrane protease YdiL (CAAX protease family)